MKLDQTEDSSQRGDGDRLDVVAISDIHVHPWSAHSTGTGLKNSRLQQTLNVLRASLQEAQDRDGLWVCAGDLVDTAGHMKNVVANAVINTLNRYPEVRKYIIFGNHDSRGRGATSVDPDETSTAAIAEAVENMTLLHQEFAVTKEGLSIYGEGAQPRARHYRLSELPEEGADIALLHDIVEGSQTPSGHELSGKFTPESLMEKFGCTIIGDVHHPTYWSKESRLVLVPGSPEHHNFGDKGRRGYWVLPLQESGEGWQPILDQVQMVPSDSPLFITVDDPDDLPDEDDGNFYRVKGGNVREDQMPEGVKVVSSPPSTVDSRDALEGASSRREILERWLKETPFELDVDEEEMIERGLEMLPSAGGIDIKPSKVVNVHAQDFFSYEDFKWDIEGGVHLVVGESADFDSNGSGKSTLFEAIYWCLFGRTTKGVSAGDEIRWGADECRVSVAMMVGDEPCLIERRRDSSGPSLDITIDGEPVAGSSVREVQENFTDWLGVSEDIYRALAYFSQEDVLLFSRSTDAERKALLADLCGLSSYDKASSEASSRASEYWSEKERADSTIESATARLERLTERYEERENKEREFEENRVYRLQELEEKKEKLEGSERPARLRDRLEEIHERRDTLLQTWQERREEQVREQEERRAANRRDDLKSKLESRANHLQEAKDRLDELPDPTDENLEEAGNNLSEAENEVQELKFRIERRESEKEHFEEELERVKGMESGEECPRCGQQVGMDHIEEMGAEIREMIAELDEDIEELQEQVEVKKEDRDNRRSHLDKLEKAQEVEAAIQDHRETISELKESLSDLDELTETRIQSRYKDLIGKDENRLRAYVERAEEFVGDWIGIHEDKIEDAERTIREMEERTNPHSEALEELTTEIENAEQEIKEQQGVSQDAALKAEMMEYWAEGFSKRGIQSLLLEEVAALFNQHRDRVFPLLTRGKYDVQFSTRSKTQSGEERERTEFIVRDEGTRIPYENLSGGQRRRVDLGVMLTLTMANAEMRNVPGIFGLLLLDECADHLDAEGVEALAETLKVEVSETIPHIYVVSQDTEMKSLFPSVVEVYQDESGTSHLVEE